MINIILRSEAYANYPYGEVVDEQFNVIGEAHSYTYGGCAFAVHTKPFAGYVRFDECRLWRKDAAGQIVENRR